MNEKIHCQFIDWDAIQGLTTRLAQKIKGDGYNPDIAIAIARGGYVPARLICDQLNIYNLTSMRVAHYISGAQMNQDARISSPLNVDIKGLNVLVVDDVNDTGDTLQVTLDHVHSFNPAEVRVAVLHHKTVSSIEPDYYGEKVTHWQWLIYPWAVIEDLRSFMDALETKPMSVEEAGDMLRRKHGINVTESILVEAYRQFVDM